MEKIIDSIEKIFEKIEGIVYYAIVFLMVFFIVFLATNAKAEYIDDDNYRPYATNKLITLGTFTGNKFQYTLQGGDPDRDDIYFIIPDSQDSFLVSNKIYCEIFHANQLVCEIDENKYINPTSKCVMKDDFIVNECETVEFTYYVQDEKGKRSKKDYTVRLYIVKPQKGSNKTDIRTNARGFFFEAQDRALGNEFGIAAYSKNPAESLMNTELFNNSTPFGKQFNVAKDLMATGDPDVLTNEDLASNTHATSALDETSVSLSANRGGGGDFVTNTMTETLKQLGVNALITTKVTCLIERLGVRTKNYYYCPWIDDSPKFIAENAVAQLKQQHACQDICKETAKCEDLNQESYADFVIDKNFLDDLSYISAENSATDISHANKIYLTKKRSDGTIISNKTIDTTLNTSDLTWDTSIIPSIKTINSEIILKTKFLSDDKFTETTSGSTYILRPVISYYAVIDSEEVLNSYDGTTLFSIKFSNEATKYQCPLPLLSATIYDDRSVCNKACVTQYDCLYKTDSVENVDGFGSIDNHCKDIEIIIDGVNKTLEQAVEDGNCRLTEEIAINDYQKPTAEYIINGMPGKDYAVRPDIGFEEGEAILFKERATEIAYAFNDMLMHGKEQGRFDETDKLDSKLFKDFHWKKSNNLFAALPVVTGKNFANMNIDLLIKLNEAYFNRYRYLTKSYSELNTDFERDVYEVFKETLQLPLWVKYLDYYSIDEATFNKEDFKQKLFNSTINPSRPNPFVVGIIVGLLDVDIPIAYDENTSTYIEFKILDKNNEFRTVSIIPTFPLDENNESQMIVYTEYLRAAGREIPNYFAFINWADYVEKNNLTAERLRNMFESTIDSDPDFNINSYANYLTSIKKTSLNSMLNNYTLAHNGIFNPNTMSFETVSNPTHKATPVIVNKDVYESYVTSAYTFLKAYYNDQSLISMPLKITTNALSPTSLYQHRYRYLFVYVDKVENLNNLKVKDLMDILYNDYKSGEKKYFVWDFKDKDRAVKKINDTVTAWHDTEALNHYGKYFTVDSFSYLDSSDIVSTFYEDITNAQKDSVYIAKRGDSYIVKMNTSGENVVYGDKACPDDKPYDPATKKCVYKTTGCPSGYEFGAVTGDTSRCEHLITDLESSELCNNPLFSRLYHNGTTSGCFIPAEKIHFKYRYADLNRRRYTSWTEAEMPNSFKRKIKFSYAGNVDKNDDLDFMLTIDGIDNSKIHFCRRYADHNRRDSADWVCVNGGEELRTDFVGGVDTNDDLDFKLSIDGIDTSYISFSQIFRGNSGTTNSSSINSDGILLIDYSENVNCGDTHEFNLNFMKPVTKCKDGKRIGFDPISKKSYCYTKAELVAAEDNPSCPDETWQVDTAGNCFKIDNSLKDIFNKNGYYFLYLEKDSNPNIDFLTPVVNESPIECKKKSTKCSLNGIVYSSQDSCQKYCKQTKKEKKVYTSERKNSRSFEYSYRSYSGTSTVNITSGWSAYAALPDSEGICIDKDTSTRTNCVSWIREHNGYLQAKYVPIKNTCYGFNYSDPVGWFNVGNTPYPITVGLSPSGADIISSMIKQEGGTFYLKDWDASNLTCKPSEFLSTSTTWEAQTKEFCIAEVGPTSSGTFECVLKLKPVITQVCPDGYQSDNSGGCYKYETVTGLDLTYGKCEDISTKPLPNLTNDSFYKLETCSSKCYKEEQKNLDYIKVRLRIGDDIATQKGNIKIKKYLTDGTAVDYSDQIVTEPISGNIYLSETNNGIDMGALMKNNQITIKYSTSFNGSYYTIGLGRANQDFLENPRNITPGYILDGGNYESCANMSAYYSNMGLYLDVDKDDDGVYEDSIKISDTFVCYSYSMHTLAQNITFDGDKIEYEYIDYLGFVTSKTKNIYIKDYGVCKTNTDQTDQVPLSRTFLTKEYVPYASPIKVTSPDSVDSIKATVEFARKPFVSNFGKVSRDMTAYFNYLKNPGKYVEDWRNAINKIKNIPIPFYEGVYAIDDFDIMLKNTDLDYFFQSSVGNYKLKGGFGFVPWTECKSFKGEKTTTDYTYSDKTNCVSYPGYWYDSSIKKCVGSKKYNASTGSYYCAYGTLNTVSDVCEAMPTCQDDYEIDPANPDRCYKSIYTTGQAIISVCKPWWKILRTYECSNVGNAFDYSNFVTIGPPRWVEVCDPSSKVRLYKNLAIDKDGNIVDTSEVKIDGVE